MFKKLNLIKREFVQYRNIYNIGGVKFWRSLCVVK